MAKDRIRVRVRVRVLQVSCPQTPASVWYNLSLRTFIADNYPEDNSLVDQKLELKTRRRVPTMTPADLRVFEWIKKKI